MDKRLKFKWLEAVTCDENVSPTGMRIANLFVLVYYGPSGRIFPSIDTMAARLKVDRCSVMRGVESLEREGWIEARRTKGKSTRYGFLTSRIIATSRKNATSDTDATTPVAKMSPDQSQKCHPNQGINQGNESEKSKTSLSTSGKPEKIVNHAYDGWRKHIIQGRAT